METVALIFEASTGIGTLILAGVTYLTVREIRQDRRLGNFDRELERVARLEGEEFFLFLGRLVEHWCKDRKLGAHVRAMQARYKERRKIFQKQVNALRPMFDELIERLVRKHPEAADDGLVGRQVIEGARGMLEVDLSLKRFRQLAEGDELREREHPMFHAYNSFVGGDRNIEEEEPIAETAMLEIMRSRLTNLPEVDEEIQKRFANVERQLTETMRAFADWKKTAPEYAMRELLVIAGALGKDVYTDNADVEGLAFGILINGYPKESVYKRLLERASSELRTALQ